MVFTIKIANVKSTSGSTQNTTPNLNLTLFGITCDNLMVFLEFDNALNETRPVNVTSLKFTHNIATGSSIGLSLSKISYSFSVTGGTIKCQKITDNSASMLKSGIEVYIEPEKDRECFLEIQLISGIEKSIIKPLYKILINDKTDKMLDFAGDMNIFSLYDVKTYVGKSSLGLTQDMIDKIDKITEIERNVNSLLPLQTLFTTLKANLLTYFGKSKTNTEKLKK